MQDAEEKEMWRSSRSRSRMGKVQRCAVLLLLSPCLLGRLMFRADGDDNDNKEDVQHAAEQ